MGADYGIRNKVRGITNKEKRDDRKAEIEMGPETDTQAERGKDGVYLTQAREFQNPTVRSLFSPSRLHRSSVHRSPAHNSPIQHQRSCKSLPAPTILTEQERDLISQSEAQIKHWAHITNKNRMNFMHD